MLAGLPHGSIHTQMPVFFTIDGPMSAKNEHVTDSPRTLPRPNNSRQHSILLARRRDTTSRALLIQRYAVPTCRRLSR